MRSAHARIRVRRGIARHSHPHENKGNPEQAPKIHRDRIPKKPVIGRRRPCPEVARKRNLSLFMTVTAGIAAGVSAHKIPEAWRAPHADPVAPFFSSC
jgi:hypothetical protein